MDEPSDVTIPIPAPPAPDQEFIEQDTGSGYASLQIGDVLRDRFELKQLLGEGGMSRVFLAVDRLRVEANVADSTVAIKLLKNDLAKQPEALAMLQREAGHMQRLAHPNIATVYDVDRHEEVPYIVMEYVRGQELNHSIRGQPTGMPLRVAASMIAELSLGLSYAHQQGVLHLDFKPSNVLVLPNGRVKIFDFGLARSLTKDQDDLGMLGFTPAYASPELQNDRSTVDVRDDVFSFAVTVYQLLTGKHPFGGVVPSHGEDAAPAKIPQLTTRQWRALRAGLELNRIDRAASVAEVADPLTKTRRNWTAIPRRLLTQVGIWVSALKPTPTTINVATDHQTGKLWIADKPIHLPDEDGLEYIDYAKALFGIFDHPRTQPPLTIAINGGFGIGKSSVALLTQHLLSNKLEDNGEKPHLTAWMQIGKYRGAASLRAFFVCDFVRDLYFSQPLWFRLANRLPKSFLLPGEVHRRRLCELSLLLAVGFAGFYLAEGQSMGDLSEAVDYSSIIGLLSSSFLAVLLWLSSMLGSLKSLSDYVNPSDASFNATHHAEARKQIEKMVDKITRGNTRLVLFVDDLERSPERTPEVLDILESLFSTPKCVVVIPTDLSLLGAALERHSNVSDGQIYLQKYVQLQFDMPAVENSRLLELVLRQEVEVVKPEVGPSGSTLFSLGYETIAFARDRIDQHILDDGMSQLVMNTVGIIPATEWDRLVEERKQRALPESYIYKAAVKCAVTLAGSDIRNAKRISNQIRLYVFVLFQRDLLHSNSTLTAEHVGRWVALKELWPEVAYVISRSPDLFSVLNRWVTDSETTDRITGLNLAVAKVGALQGGLLVNLISPWGAARTESLHSFLQAEPRLNNLVVEQLCYLRESV